MNIFEVDAESNMHDEVSQHDSDLDHHDQHDDSKVQSIKSNESV